MRISSKYDYPQVIKFRLFSASEFIDYFNNLLMERVFDDPFGESFDNINFVDLPNATVGQFGMHFTGDDYTEVGFAFDKSVLDGKSYALSEIDDLIIHEVAHVFANMVYKEDCGHDIRWEEFCIRLGKN